MQEVPREANPTWFPVVVATPERLVAAIIRSDWALERHETENEGVCLYAVKFTRDCACKSWRSRTNAPAH
jgi:hypothetical protein